MAGTIETPQFFDVQMQQVTRLLMFIALYQSGRFQVSQSIQSHSLQDTGNGTEPYAQRLADVPIGQSLLAQFDNPLLALVINGIRQDAAREERLYKPSGPSWRYRVSHL